MTPKKFVNYLYFFCDYDSKCPSLTCIFLWQWQHTCIFFVTMTANLYFSVIMTANLYFSVTLTAYCIFSVSMTAYLYFFVTMTAHVPPLPVLFCDNDSIPVIFCDYDSTRPRWFFVSILELCVDPGLPSFVLHDFPKLIFSDATKKCCGIGNSRQPLRSK